MPPTSRFEARIGKVFLPEPEVVDSGDDFTPNPEGPELPPGLPGSVPGLEGPFKWPPDRIWPKFCVTALKAGCYTIGFTPLGTSVLGTRYRGTLRIEPVGRRLRMSGDLYAYRLFDDIVVKWPVEKARLFGPDRGAGLGGDGPGEAADTGGVIPIYRRNKYRSYLKGTGAQLFKVVAKGTTCSFTLSFDEFVYNHPASGFSGSFNAAPTRAIRFVLRHTGTADLYSGEAYDGATQIGTVSIRWISDFYRRAHLQLNTLNGAEAPPAAVGGATFSTIFADAGWDLSFTDGGGVPLPAALAGININACWSMANYHTLMTSVPGYNAADLDTVWRVHLVAVPATLGCSRGFMFDSSLGADPNSVPREGSATHSRDGYPAGDCPDGMGGSHYDGAANQQQRNVPRAFLRSATHEVGHAFNQIHQQFELGADNSIMSPTPSVATVIGIGGTFPDDITLAFNDTVKRHLRHLPDPAVRPGAMDFFGSAVSAPEASDVAWPETLELRVTPSSDTVALGEPIDLAYTLTNNGDASVPVPRSLDVASLTARISVTDPSGRITFMRPYNVHACPDLELVELAPGRSLSATAPLFWGRDGFAFETPGRHVIEVIALWNVAGVHVAAAGSQAVFVAYPVSKTDNDMAALLLDPDVGRAIATKRAWEYAPAAQRIKQAVSRGGNHPAARAVARLAVLTPPRKTASRAGGTRRAKTPKARSPRKR